VLADDEPENAIPQKLHPLVAICATVGERRVRQRAFYESNISERVADKSLYFGYAFIHERALPATDSRVTLLG
jgi:hypothetical protein